MAAPLLVQDTPDLSGRWVLEERSPRAPDVPRVISVSQSIARTNVRGDSMKPFVKKLTVAREFDDGWRSDTYRVGTVGGSTPGVRAHGPARGGLYTHHRVAWDGRALVFEWSTSAGPTPRSGDWADRREGWWLDEMERLRVTITTSAARTLPGTLTAMYRRAAAPPPLERRLD